MKPWYLLILTVFLSIPASADTVILKNEKELKGLIVEQHEDRVILSTEKGEVPVFRAGITNIKFDDPSQNFYQVGSAYEKEGKYGEALAYYEKSLELNPSAKETQMAASRVRNHFWQASTEGPKGEIEKRQLLSDAYGTGKLPKKGTAVNSDKELKDRLGIRLKRRGDWNSIMSVDSSKPFGQAGLRMGDELVSIDGQSLRFLNASVVTKKLLEPHASHIIIQTQRDLVIMKESPLSLSDIGFNLKLEYDGLVITEVASEGRAYKAGLRDNDLLIFVNGSPTRYTPMGKVKQIIEDPATKKIVFSVRRNFFVTPK